VADKGDKPNLKIVDEEGNEKPGFFRITFEDMVAAKSVPDMRGIITAAPQELGLDPDELGIPKGSTIGLVFRPFKPGENAEIRETVKDFPEDMWLQELHDEMILHCLEEPAIPNTAEGRKQLQRWLPGFRSTLATAIQQQSGMGAHTVKDAKSELGKLRGLTRSTSSTSESVTNIA
jgi:hypothetical protein